MLFHHYHTCTGISYKHLGIDSSVTQQASHDKTQKLNHSIMGTAYEKSDRQILQTLAILFQQEQSDQGLHHLLWQFCFNTEDYTVIYNITHIYIQLSISHTTHVNSFGLYQLNVT